eukprot:m.138977 g.138977  ORF g.138977 m.138977 type:complete len:1816 (+) comp38261_c1_seq2:172-5619(+)
MASQQPNEPFNPQNPPPPSQASASNQQPYFRQTSAPVSGHFSHPPGHFGSASLSGPSLQRSPSHSSSPQPAAVNPLLFSGSGALRGSSGSQSEDPFDFVGKPTLQPQSLAFPSRQQANYAAVGAQMDPTTQKRRAEPVFSQTVPERMASGGNFASFFDGGLSSNSFPVPSQSQEPPVNEGGGFEAEIVENFPPLPHPHPSQEEPVRLCKVDKPVEDQPREETLCQSEVQQEQQQQGELNLKDSLSFPGFQQKENEVWGQPENQEDSEEVREWGEIPSEKTVFAAEERLAETAEQRDMPLHQDQVYEVQKERKQEVFNDEEVRDRGVDHQESRRDEEKPSIGVLPVISNPLEQQAQSPELVQAVHQQFIQDQQHPLYQPSSAHPSHPIQNPATGPLPPQDLPIPSQPKPNPLPPPPTNDVTQAMFQPESGNAAEITPELATPKYAASHPAFDKHSAAVFSTDSIPSNLSPNEPQPITSQTQEMYQHPPMETPGGQANPTGSGVVQEKVQPVLTPHLPPSPASSHSQMLVNVSSSVLDSQPQSGPHQSNPSIVSRGPDSLQKASFGLDSQVNPTYGSKPREMHESQPPALDSHEVQHVPQRTFSDSISMQPPTAHSRGSSFENQQRSSLQQSQLPSGYSGVSYDHQAGANASAAFPPTQPHRGSIPSIPDQYPVEGRREPSAFHDPRRQLLAVDQWQHQPPHFAHESDRQPYVPSQSRYQEDRGYYGDGKYGYGYQGSYDPRYHRDPYQQRDYYNWHHYYPHDHQDGRGSYNNYYQDERHWRQQNQYYYEAEGTQQQHQQHQHQQYDERQRQWEGYPYNEASHYQEEQSAVESMPLERNFNNEVSAILPVNETDVSALPDAAEQDAQTYKQSFQHQQYFNQQFPDAYETYVPEASWQPVNKTPSPPPRATPVKFSRPHVVARFGSGGQLVTVLPQLLASDKPRPVEISLMKCQEDDSLLRFPGPLIREETPKTEVIEFAMECARKCREGNASASSALLWEYLALLCRQNGRVDGSDASDLLLRQSQSEGHFQKMLTQPRLSESDMQMAEQQFRNLLLAGRKKQALDLAVKKHLWGHAFMLASKMESRVQLGVTNRFIESCERNDPLHTYYVMASGKQPLAVRGCSDPSYGDWKVHLGMIIANKEDGVKNVLTMAHNLAFRDLHASHLCYLFGDLKPGPPNDERSKFSLLGVDHHRPLAEYVTHEAIQRTEVLEYGFSLADPYFCIPSLQIFKFLYMCDLIDFGLASKALRYCEGISYFVALKPGQFYPSFLCQLYEIGLRLHYSDVHSSSLYNDELPDWLARLGDIIQKRQDGSIPLTQPYQPARPVSALSGAFSAASGHQTPTIFQQGEPSDTLQVPPTTKESGIEHSEHTFTLPYVPESGFEQLPEPGTAPHLSSGRPNPSHLGADQQYNSMPQQQQRYQPESMNVASGSYDQRNNPSSQWVADQQYNSQQQQRFLPRSGTELHPRPMEQYNASSNWPSDQQYNPVNQYGQFGDGQMNTMVGEVGETFTDGPFQTKSQSAWNFAEGNDLHGLRGGQANVQEGYTPVESKADKAKAAGNENQVKEEKKEEKERKSHPKKQSESLFRRIWGKLAPGSGQVHLPDDKDKDIYWDEEKKRWINKGATEGESTGPVAPPTDSELHNKGMGAPARPFPQPLPQPQPMTASQNASDNPNGEVKSGPPSMFSRLAHSKGLMNTRSKYVDVLNPTGGSASVPSLPGPPLPLPTQSFTGSIFVPSSDAAQTGDNDDASPGQQAPQQSSSMTLYNLATSSDRTGAQTPDRMSEVSEYSQEVRQHMGYGQQRQGGIPLHPKPMLATV